MLIPEWGKLQNDILFANDWYVTGHNNMVKQTSW